MSMDQSVPMCRLTDRMVRSGLVTAWRFATSPTSTSPFFANATTLGVVREPSALAMTLGSPPSRTVTTLLVVPRSMPTARAMEVPPNVCGRSSTLSRCHSCSTAGPRLSILPCADSTQLFFPIRRTSDRRPASYPRPMLGRLQDRRGEPNLRTRLLAGLVIVGLVVLTAPLVVIPIAHWIARLV